MERKQLYKDIVERAESVRKLLSMNKSRFSRRIGMKPQSYNNFTGAQGSKPNLELIYGLVNEYKVNPRWLLNGVGEMFYATPPEKTDDNIRSSRQLRKSKKRHIQNRGVV
ncbi:MAG: helix-turn-helix transcriptional regulator [SAR324 cluster bacterium]|nr:helix-turn-helix transcriptional regulator [SAR324 cluster bacterium]